MPSIASSLRHHVGDVQAIQFDDSGEFIVSGDSLGEAVVWSIESQRPRVIIKDETCSQTSILQISWQDTDEIVIQKRSGQLSLFSLGSSSSKLVSCLDTDYFGFCRGCALYREKQILLPDIKEGNVNLWDFTSKLKILSLIENGSSSPGHCTAISNAITFLWKGDWQDNKRLLLGYEGGSIRCWDLRMPSGHIFAYNCFRGPITDLVIDNRGEGVIVGSTGDSLMALKVNESEVVKCKEIKLKEEGVSRLAIRRDRRLFASLQSNGLAVSFFSYRNLRDLGSIRQSPCQALSLDFSINNMLACGSKNGSITVWDPISATVS